MVGVVKGGLKYYNKVNSVKIIKCFLLQQNQRCRGRVSAGLASAGRLALPDEGLWLQEGGADGQDDRVQPGGGQGAGPGKGQGRRPQVPGHAQ